MRTLDSKQSLAYGASKGITNKNDKMNKKLFKQNEQKWLSLMIKVKKILKFITRTGLKYLITLAE